MFVLVMVCDAQIRSSKVIKLILFKYNLNSIFYFFKKYIFISQIMMQRQKFLQHKIALM